MSETETAKAPKPAIGRIVHFVQKKPYGEGLVHLPAIIIAVWSDDCVNLQVFTDGTNSESCESCGSNPPSAKWVTSAFLDDSENPRPLTWHWPERD
jgi:hypothetical protein